MRYLTFTSTEQSSYDICFLVPQLHRGDISSRYIEPYLVGDESEILAYDLYKEGKRTPVKIQREYLDELLPTLKDLGVRYMVVCDTEYLKTLTKAPTADKALGYVLDCAHPGFEDMKVIYCPNFRAVFYNPDKVLKEIRTSLEALTAHRQGAYIDPGMGIIKFAAYPSTVDEIDLWLHRLLEMDCDLTADIEGFSLKHYDAGIGTISFAWSKHEGISFPVDLLEHIPDRIRVRRRLKEFFQQYAERARTRGRKMMWHRINFDVTVLVYQLFMKDLLDTEGLLEGLGVMLAGWDCTRLITYLATNSCAGNQLGLKVQAQEFAGNYAVEDITDIRKIPLPHLLQYNLVDSLSTWFVYEKHWDTLVADNQLEIYKEIFKPGIWDIIQMQLTGLPVEMDRVKEVKKILQIISDQAIERMQNNTRLESFIYEWRLGWIEKENQKLKTKTRSYEEAEAKVTFNPNSPPQLQTLLYDEKHFGLPVIDLTKTKAPATGGDTLEKLKNHTKDPQVIDFLEALMDYKAIDKILTSFIPAFELAPQGPDGWHYLFGFFNLGGTVSGRLSSSDPNLQNLPANVFMTLVQALVERFEKELGPYIKKGKLSLGKFVKSCFKAPPGYLFIGLDFASLEDRISALTTKDPNKLKVYLDGYDGHCLRAFSYFAEEMEDIDPDSVESINSIATQYPSQRQESKTPTFLLTYGGTFIGMMGQLGWEKDKAQTIEARYHELYQVSDEWIAARIQEAGQQGYVEVAFGLRVRTPLLHQVILGNSRTPYEAESEGRTAGNALGQSWCLLNTRAGSEFMGVVRSGEYRLDIRPSAHIHDAQYLIIPDDMNVLRYVNKHLVQAVEWQDDPAIWHDEVKLGGELSIFYPDWAAECVIPNNASVENITAIAEKHYEKYCA